MGERLGCFCNYEYIYIPFSAFSGSHEDNTVVRIKKRTFRKEIWLTDVINWEWRREWNG